MALDINKLTPIEQQNLSRNIEALKREGFDFSRPNLYKYHDDNEKKVEYFEDDVVRVGQPKWFNDPWDCVPFVDYLKIADKVKKNFEMQPELVSLLEALIDDIRAKFDEYVGADMCVGCFSARNDSILLWSHYASSHRGFVLSYDYDDLNDAGKSFGALSIMPVVYRNSREDCTEYVEYIINLWTQKHLGCVFLPESNRASAAMRKIVMFKSNDWKYENEWRMLIPSSPSAGEYKLTVKPTAIFLGEKMSSEMRSRLIDIAKRKGIQVNESYIDKSSRDYKVESRMLT